MASEVAAKVWTPDMADVPPPPDWVPAPTAQAAAPPAPPTKRDAYGPLVGGVLDTLGRTTRPGARTPKDVFQAPQGVAENVIQQIPYVTAMGMLPEIAVPAEIAMQLGLAARLALAGMRIGPRLGLAGAIGAAEAPEGTRTGKGLTALALQAAGELATPVVGAGMRLGGRAIERMSDWMVGRVMAGAKRLVPAWHGLPETQQGFQALVTDEGMARLGDWYGGEVRKALGAALKGEKIPLSAADAQALKLTPRSPIYPNGNVLVDATEAAVAGRVLGKALPAGANVSAALDQLVGVLRATKPAVATRISAVLSGAAIEAQTRTYSEGVNLVDTLLHTNALDPATKRLDPKSLIEGLDKSFGGQNPETVWTRYLTTTKAPGAATLLRGLVPRGMQAPERVGMPFLRMPLVGHHVAMGEKAALTLGSRHVPWSPPEQTIRRLAPIAAGSLIRGAVPMEAP